MNEYRWIDPRVKDISIEALCSWMKQHDRQQIPSPRPQILLFQGPKDDFGEPIVLVLPASKQLSDWLRGVEVIITSLSVIHRRHPREILEEVLAIPVSNCVNEVVVEKVTA
jgi:hypothetical protein